MAPPRGLVGTTWLGALALALPGARVQAQSAGPAADSAIVQLGPEHARSRSLLGLGGDGWRAAWGEPVRLPVLGRDVPGGVLVDLELEEGPLRGVSVGRTQADGLAWRVLPVHLDPVVPLLPPEARTGDLPSFLRDLVSALHPTAPLLAASLYRAAGLVALPRTLGIVPEGMPLPAGAVRAGAAAWVERAPELDGRAYLGFSRLITTDSLLARQRMMPGTRVDFEAYLAARLTDVILGDRGRGPLGWLWGWSEERGLWVPVARGQEQALMSPGRGSRLLLGAYGPGFVSFGSEQPRTRALTARAWDLDRPWLARLDRATWDRVAATLAARLDDAAIAGAVTALPAEHRRLSGDAIAAALRARRDALPRVVDEYYRLMTRYADLEITDLADTMRVTRLADGAVEVSLERDGASERLRRFVPTETEELRLHLLGGDDRLVLEGVERGGVKLRITGGDGLDRVERPGPGARQVVLYDAEDGMVRVPVDAARLTPHAAGRQLRWQDVTAPPPPDWGVRFAPQAVLGFNGDLGLIVGVGGQWKWNGFDERFHRQRARLTLAYATKPSSFRGTASFERRDVLRDVHLSAEVLGSGIEVVRFHGFGNETADSADGAFYRAVHEEYTGRLLVGLSGDPDAELRVGPVISLLSTDTTGGATLVAEQNPYGAGRFHVAGVEADYRYHPRRSPFATGFGISVMASGQYFPAVLDAEGAFGGLSGEVDATWVPRLGGRLILAGRLGGSILRGKVPFGRTARVGGPRTLRGYAVDRFAGDRGSAYGSLELRSRLTRFRLGLAPGDLGVLAYGSGGRVWQEGESSSIVHWAGGGGLWVAPTINWLPDLSGLVARVEVAHSTEGTFFYFGTGFRF